MVDDGKPAEKDVDATAAAIEEALKASDTPLPLKVIIGVVRMVLRHTTSQGKLEPEYATLDEEQRRRQLEQLVRDSVIETVEPLATAALEQLDANTRLEGRIDRVVELLYRLISGRVEPASESATPIIQQQIIVQSGATANIGVPTIAGPTRRDADFEGPGGVPITAVAGFSGRTKELQDLELPARLRALARSEDRVLSFVGFPPDLGRKPQVLLSGMFVPPSLTAPGAMSKEVEFEDLARRCVELPSDGEPAVRAVILGEPGSGKSSLCRMLAVRAVQREPGPVPLVLRLRELVAGEEELSVLEIVARQLGRRGSTRVEASVLELLSERGQAVLLVDGLDEFSDAGRELLVEHLNGFAAVHTRTPIVVTSRETGYGDARLGLAFKQLHIERFDDPRLQAFIERWYDLAIPDDPDVRSRERARLIADLDLHPAARALARTPLLATLIALVHQQQGTLPARRVELYRACIELLVRDWPEKWSRALPELPGDVQIERLGVLAWWMQKARTGDAGDGVSVARDTLDDFLATILATQFESPQCLSLAPRWRRWLVDSGLLQEEIPGTYAFVHLTLMEYLAARRQLTMLRVEGGDIADFIVKHCSMPSWREVLLLMLGSHATARDLCEEVLRRVVNTGAHETIASFLLAALREGLSIGEPLRSELFERAASILATQTIRPRHSSHADIVAAMQHSEPHGAAAEAWLVRTASHASGRALLGALILAPPSLALEPQLEARTLPPEDMTLLLALGREERWGAWALRAAQRKDLLRWSTTASPRWMIGHVLRTSVVRDDAAATWVAGMLRRSAWLSEELLAKGASGAGEWVSMGATFFAVYKPAFVVASSRPCELETEARHESVSEGDATLEFLLRLPQESALTEQPFRRFHRCLQEQDIFANYGNRFQGLSAGRRSLDHALNAIRRFHDLHDLIDGKHLQVLTAAQINQVMQDTPAEDRAPVSVPGSASLPQRRPPDADPQLRPWPWLAPEGFPVEEALTRAFVLEFHAGVVAHEDNLAGRVIGTMRVQNRWLHLFFDLLVDHIARETGATPTTLSPGRQAILLVFGLVQFQTTWRWPHGERWPAWFENADSPAHWLPAYVWHLCKAVGDPGNPDHLASAEACLARSDWAELASTLHEQIVRADACPGACARSS
jgi:hypothetical protein